MTRILLIIALVYVALVWLSHKISHNMSGTTDDTPPSRRPNTKSETTVTRIEEPRQKVLDPADADYAEFEEVE